MVSPYNKILKSPFLTLSLRVVFAARVHQDQVAQNVRPDFRSTLSTILEHYRQTRAITEHDQTPHQRIVIEQVLVTEWRMVK